MSMSVSAYFTRDHLYFTIYAFDHVDSPTANLCRDKLETVLDGNTMADVPVLHYYDEKVGSYIATHSRGSGYQSCLNEAGADTELRCACIGDALHILQDSFSHNEGGLVVKYLKQDHALNFGGHMTVERSFQDVLEPIIASDPIVTSGRLDYYDSIVLDSFFTETSGDEKYLVMFNKMSGINMNIDAAVFRAGYQGEGFYNTVYKDKLKLPAWLWSIAIALSIVGVLLSVIIYYFGRTQWKWLTGTAFLIIGIIGIVLLISFFTGTTWMIVTKIIEVPPMFGILKVSEADAREYNEKIKEASMQFLRTGDLVIDDASGLTYIDRNNDLVSGSLGKAESGSKIWFYSILFIIAVLLSLFIMLTFKNKKK